MSTISPTLLAVVWYNYQPFPTFLFSKPQTKSTVSVSFFSSEKPRVLNNLCTTEFASRHFSIQSEKKQKPLVLGWGCMHYTPSHTNVCKFLNFNLHFPGWYYTWNAEILQGYLSKGVLLVLVFVFNFDLFEISAAILEEALLFISSIDELSQIDLF